MYEEQGRSEKEDLQDLAPWFFKRFDTVSFQAPESVVNEENVESKGYRLEYETSDDDVKANFIRGGVGGA